MKITYWINFIVLFLFAVACSETKQESQATSTDTTQNTAREEVKEPQKITVAINPTESKVTWERTKEAKNQDQTIKIGGKPVNIKVGAIKLTTTGEIPFKEGSWTMLDNEMIGGTFKLDMKAIKGLNINQNQQVEFGNPENLDVDKYPEAILEIEKIMPDTSQQDYNHTLEGKLATPKTGEVTLDNLKFKISLVSEKANSSL